MQHGVVLLALAAALAAGCKNVDCGDGTTERNGACVPSSETVGTAQCGPFTELQGDVCVPMFSPTVCDPDTTDPDTDDKGVTTCVAKGGGGGCSSKLACPAPTDGKQTICGQIYDFENNAAFAQAGAAGGACTAGCNATSGPCALTVRAYDAVALAMAPNPATVTPLTTGAVYIDDCGRYKVPEITLPGTSPFIALSFDDATMPGPAGVTNMVGIATASLANTATKDLDAFIVKKSTSDAWTSSGGPPLDTMHGIYAPVYRGHRTGTDLASGVTFTFGPNGSPPPVPTMSDANRDFYFGVDTRTTLSAGASATGSNGTALVAGASLLEVYSGNGGLPAECRWDIHAGASIPFVIFIQIFRPINNGPSATCTL